jgi:hypothetical protein
MILVHIEIQVLILRPSVFRPSPPGIVTYCDLSIRCGRLTERFRKHRKTSGFITYFFRIIVFTWKINDAGPCRDSSPDPGPACG